MAHQAFDDEILGKAFDARLAKKAFVFVKPHMRRVVLALVIMFLTTAANLTAPWLQQMAIDDGIMKGNTGLLVRLSVCYVLVWLFYWLTQYVQSRLVASLAQRVILSIRRTLFLHIQSQSLDFFDNREVGRIISRLTSDVGALNQFLTSASLSLVTDSLMLVGVLVLMIKMDLRLALMTFTAMPLMLIITILFRGRARLAYRDVRRKVATVTASVAENVSGVREVKSFSREEENLKRFEQINLDNRRAVMNAVRVSAVIWPMIEIIKSVAQCTVVTFGGYQVLLGALKVGMVWAFIAYIDRFFTPLQNMSQFYYTMQSAMAGAERIFEILETEPTIQDKPGAVEMPRIRGEVEFRNVTFAYGDTPILKGVSFTARAGDTIALVGPTGAGKTTIISLVARQYDITGGEILIDGVDIRDVTTHSLRSQMGVVLQDSFLFPGTVKDNLRYGRLDATDGEVEAAARSLGVHEFIAGLARSYNTEIQEGASNISTGQKQLLSFVRALLADPKILILDEATSSVDAYTEMVIQEALRKLLAGRTSFVVAHRLSTIAEADKILVIEDGRIAELGTHEELLQMDGLYRKLYDVQFSLLEETGEVVASPDGYS